MTLLDAKIRKALLISVLLLGVVIVGGISAGSYLSGHFAKAGQTALKELEARLGHSISYEDISFKRRSLTLLRVKVGGHWHFERIDIELGIPGLGAGLISSVSAYARELQLRPLRESAKGKSLPSEERLIDRLRAWRSELRLVCEQCQIGRMKIANFSARYLGSQPIVNLSVGQWSLGQWGFEQPLTARVVLSENDITVHVSHGADSKLRIVKKKQSEDWDFDLKAHSRSLRYFTGLPFDLAHLSRGTWEVDGQLDPYKRVRFSLRAGGISSVKKGRSSFAPLDLEAIGDAEVFGDGVVLSRAEVQLGPTKKKDRMSLSVTGSLRTRQGLSLEMTLPQQKCASLAQILSGSSVLRRFEIAGDIAGRLKIAGKKREDLVAHLENPKFDCQLTTEDPHVITAERLKVANGLTTAFQRASSFTPVEKFYVPGTDIPKEVKTVFVTSEDFGFYGHEGIDFDAIAVALSHRLRGDSRILGGSTITMQLAKNLYLHGGRDLNRKIEELFLTKYLETYLNKEKILEIYLNAIEFGPGIYGIGTATRVFFNKEPQDLQLKEAVYLASLLPAPVRRFQYFCDGSVSTAMEHLMAQQLQRLLTREKISEEVFHRSLTAPVHFHRPNQLPKQCQERIHFAQKNKKDRPS